MNTKRVIKRRVLSFVLTAVMTVSSLQMPTGIIYAKEPVEVTDASGTEKTESAEVNETSSDESADAGENGSMDTSETGSAESSDASETETTDETESTKKENAEKESTEKDNTSEVEKKEDSEKKQEKRASVSDTKEKEEPEMYYYNDEDGNAYVAEDLESLWEIIDSSESLDNRAGADEEPSVQLDMPTDLKWADTRTGTMQWNAVEGSEGVYKLEIYVDDEKHYSTTWHGLPENGVAEVCGCDKFLRSGNYKFRVKALGSAIAGTGDSEWSEWSDELSYTLPNESLDIPLDLKWDGTVAAWGEVYGADGYQVEIYIKDEDGELRSRTGVLSHSDSFLSNDFKSDMIETGAYVFKVQALSPDVTKVRHSEFSDFSPEYDALATGTVFSEALDKALENVGEDPDAALQALRDALEVDDMAVAMQADDTILEKVDQLEQDYAENKNITVTINTDDHVDEYIDADKIKVVGAALNSTKDNQEMVLEFSRPDEEVQDERYPYRMKNWVQFSIDLIGRDDNDDKLLVPVQITVPIPANVEKDRFVILHYHQDETYEEIRPVINEDNTATLTVSRFSIFVFGNSVPEDEGGGDDFGEDDDIVTNGRCGDSLTWNFSDDRKLTISGEGRMFDYNEDIPEWNSYADSIVELYLGEGVASIGAGAFKACSNLSDIYYSGNEEQWKAVQIGSDNAPIVSASVHCADTGEGDEVVESVLEAPVASIPSGSVVLEGSKVELSAAEDAKIFYTLDNTDPTIESIFYDEPIVLMNDVTIKAIAVKSGSQDSSVTRLVYTVTTQKVIIVFDTQGGTPVEPLNIVKDDTADAPEPPKKEGYTFAGWYKEAECITVWDFNDIVSEDITLYAKWDIILPGYKVTFDLQGKGTELDEYKSYTDVKAGDAISRPTDPVSPGYLFLGWFKDKNCTHKWDFVNDRLEGDTYLYALWTKSGGIDGMVGEDADGAQEGLWIAGIQDYSYTGSAINPEIRAYYGTTRLVEGLDYTVKYKSNVKAASSSGGNKAPTVTIQGKGDYTGTATAAFTITKAQLVSDNLKAASEYKAGKVYTPVVMLDGNVLKEKTDYTLTYKKADGETLKKQPYKDAGSYIMHIEGTGNCEGSFDHNYTVSESGSIDIKKGKTVIEKMVFGGAYPSTTLIVDGETLGKNEYTVKFSDTDKAGNATAVFMGIGKYSGVLKKKFKVTAAPLPEGCVSVAENAPYEKGGAVPKVIVSVNGTDLIEGIDYTVSYSKNKKINSSAVVTVKGKGNYSGKQTVGFKVTSRKLDKDTMTIILPKVASGKKPSVTIFDTNGRKLSLGSDYQTQIDKTAKTVVISGGKNKLYTGKIELAYEELEPDKIITSVVLNRQERSVPKKFEYSGKEITLEKNWLTVKAKKNILSSDDFEIIGYVNNVEKGTATAIIHGKNSYGGSVLLNFKIISRKLGNINEWFGGIIGKSYTVTFNASGGSWEDDQVEKTVSARYGATIKLPDVPVYDGYVFDGWKTEERSVFTENTPVKRNIIVFAQWKAADGHTVTFKTTQGSWGNGRVQRIIKVPYGSTVKMPDTPICKGYLFTGWKTEEGEAFTDNTLVKMDMTVLAQWAPDSTAKCAVTFKANGGQWENGDTVKIVETLYGSTVNLPEEPGREGYFFSGWKTRNGSTFTEDTPVMNDITVYAQWTGRGSAEYMVTYMLNYSSRGSDVYLTQAVTSYGTAVKPTDPERDMYAFRGWYIDESAVTPYDFSSIVKSDLILYAGWGNPNGDDEGLYAAEAGGGTGYSITGVEAGFYEVDVTVNVNSSSILVVEFLNEEDYWNVMDKEFSEGTEDVAAAIGQELAALAPIDTFAVRTPDYCELSSISVPISEDSPVWDYSKYVIRAKLIDQEAKELAAPYYCIKYSARYEEFDGQTIDDVIEKHGYEADHVIPFNKQGSNFGIFSSDVKVIASSETVNVLTVEETDAVGNIVPDLKYMFANVDETASSIVTGDKIYVRGTSYLFKVGKIVKKGDGSVVITPDTSTELSDFYDILKFEATAARDSRGVSTYDISPYLEIIDVDNTFSKSIKQGLTWNPTEHIEVEASIEGKVKLSIEMSYDVHIFRDNYFKCSVVSSTEVKAKASVTAEVNNDDKVKDEWKFAKVSIPTNVPGLSVYVQPSIPMEWKVAGSGSLTFSAKLEEGFKYNTDSGYQKIDKKTYNNSISFEGEAEIKFGPKVSLGVQFLEEVVSAEVGAQAGIKGKLTLSTGLGEEWTNEESKHACGLCLEGEAKWFVDATAKLKYKITKKLKGTPIDITIISFEGYIDLGGRHPGEFYISVLNDKDSIYGGRLHFGSGSCENKQWKTMIEAKDANNNALTGVDVKITKQNSTYSETGTTVHKAYLYNGIYTVSGRISGTTEKKIFTVNGSEQTIVLTPNSSNGQVIGQVKDANTKMFIDEASVSAYQGSLVVTSIKSTSDGKFTLNLPEGVYDIKVSKDGYISYNAHIEIENGETYYETMELTPGEDGQGGFSGRIINAVSGEPVEGVTLKLRAGWGNSDINSSTIKTMTTDVDGRYDCSAKTMFGNVIIGLDAGNYTLTASKEGYETKSFNIVVTANEADKVLQDEPISPSLSEGNYRIVLTWGEYPVDLDSHVVGTTRSGDSFHVYFSDMHAFDGDTEVCNLDRDDITSYGPETITLNPTTNKPYYYYIYKYDEGEGSISTSGANIKVYGEGGLIASFNAPTDQGTGRYWNVFAIVNGKLIRKNTITSESDTGYAAGARSFTESENDIIAMDTSAEDNASKD